MLFRIHEDHNENENVNEKEETGKKCACNEMKRD